MKKILLLFSLAFLFSCKKADVPAQDGFTLYFEKPQPIQDSELSKIPNRFRGLYANSDSIFINIKEDVILKESYYKFRFHKTQMDSLKQEFDYANGKYILKINREVFDYKTIGDSIEFSNKDEDTLFAFSNTQKAKRINGQLVLNTKEAVFWKTKIIQLEKHTLKIKEMYSAEDLIRLDSLTKLKSVSIDSSTFILKPSRKEFKSILNLKHFGFELEYNKVGSK
jgi:hypothetical protein